MTRKYNLRLGVRRLSEIGRGNCMHTYLLQSFYGIPKGVLAFQGA